MPGTRSGGLEDLLTALDLVILEKGPGEEYLLLGTLPLWFRGLCPDADLDRFDAADRFPLLETFLPEAERFWSLGTHGRLKSPLWTETGPEGEDLTLEASAVSVEGRRILLVERLGACFDEMRSMLQRGREVLLDYARLARAEEALREMSLRLEKSRDDLLSVLDRLEQGAVLTDGEGRVTFLNRSAERLLGKRREDAEGGPWQDAFRLEGRGTALLEEMCARNPAERRKVPLQTEGPEGQRLWMEADVHDDPRAAEGRVFFFYDVTEIHDLRRMLDRKASFHDLVGRSKPMLRLYQQIRDVQGVDSTVLIEGETGTGKELVARAIHDSGGRKNKPFIAVNCAGLSESLIASQLFGHRRGAFTGAVADQQGLFEAADAGTLFLDEIGDIPPAVQTSLLRVLQEKEVTRVGESRTRRVDVRVLAATQRDLSREVEAGRFRLDLLYRLRVIHILLPPLRERREDIPLLVAAFLKQLRASTGKAVEEVGREAMRRLMVCTWPGNVRQLRSAVEFAVIRCKGAVVQADDLPPEVFPGQTASGEPSNLDTIEDERERVLAALDRARGNRTEAARLLGIGRATLYRHLRRLGL